MISARIPRHPPAARTLLVALVLAATGPAVGYAQSPADSAPTRKQAQQSPADRLGSAGGLELTPEQKTKLAAITNKHAEEGKAVGELFRTDPDAALKRMVALRAKMQAEVRVVLTPEQRAIFDRNVTEMNAQMNARLPMAPR